jgi:hypothetical protein
LEAHPETYQPDMRIKLVILTLTLTIIVGFFIIAFGVVFNNFPVESDGNPGEIVRETTVESPESDEIEMDTPDTEEKSQIPKILPNLKLTTDRNYYKKNFGVQGNEFIYVFPFVNRPSYDFHIDLSIPSSVVTLAITADSVDVNHLQSLIKSWQSHIECIFWINKLEDIDTIIISVGLYVRNRIKIHLAMPGRRTPFSHVGHNVLRNCLQSWIETPLVIHLDAYHFPCSGFQNIFRHLLMSPLYDKIVNGTAVLAFETSHAILSNNEQNLEKLAPYYYGLLVDNPHILSDMSELFLPSLYFPMESNPILMSRSIKVNFDELFPNYLDRASFNYELNVAGVRFWRSKYVWFGILKENLVSPLYQFTGWCNWEMFLKRLKHTYGTYGDFCKNIHLVKDVEMCVCSPTGCLQRYSEIG